MMYEFQQIKSIAFEIFFFYLQICLFLIFVTTSVVKTEPIPKMGCPRCQEFCTCQYCCDGSCAGNCHICPGNLHTLFYKYRHNF